MSITPTIGAVLSVNLNAVGPNSGLTMLTIKPDKAPQGSFVIFYSANLLPFTAIALEAMWTGKSVRIISEPSDNLPKVMKIELV